MSLSYPRRLTPILVLALAVLGIGLIYYMTARGPVIYSDSVLYLLSARNLVEQRFFGIIWSSGMLETASVHSPLYPLMIAVLYSVGMDIVQAARLVGALSFGLSILVVGLAFQRLSRRADLAISLCVVLLVAPSMSAAFSSAMSEPLLFVFMFAGLFSLLVHLQDGSVFFLVLSAICASAAFLTRFVGIAVAMTCLIGILTIPATRIWKNRWAAALLFGFTIGIAILLALAWNYFVSGTVSGARLFTAPANFALMSADFARAMLGYLWAWMAVASAAKTSLIMQVLLFALILALFVASTGLFWRRLKRSKDRSHYLGLFQIVLLFSIFIPVYLIVYYLAYVLTRPTVDLILRIFLPVYLALIVLFFGWLGLATEAFSQPWLRWLPWVFATLFLMISIPRTTSYARKMHVSGVGYLSQAWLALPVTEALRTLPSDLPVITNEPAFVKFLTDRPVYTMPESVGVPVRNPEAGFGDDPQGSRAESAFREGGALVIFPTFSSQLSMLYANDVAGSRLAALTRDSAAYQDFGDSGIYFYKPFELP